MKYIIFKIGMNLLQKDEIPFIVDPFIDIHLHIISDFLRMIKLNFIIYLFVYLGLPCGLWHLGSLMGWNLGSQRSKWRVNHWTPREFLNYFKNAKIQRH